VFAIVGTEEFPNSMGLEWITGEYFANYYKDVGILRGKSICKYPNRWYYGDKAVLAIDFSSSAMYGWD
jgi:hypothetical protein